MTEPSRSIEKIIQLPAREGAGNRASGDLIVLDIEDLNPANYAGSCHSSTVKAREPSFGAALRLPDGWAQLGCAASAGSGTMPPPRGV